MRRDHRLYCCGFGDLSFEIDCNNDDAYNLAAFLFTDFPPANSVKEPVRYDIISAGSEPFLSLWTGERKLFFGTSLYKLAYVLMNEVIFHCININDSQHALHAGAVRKQDCCILLPGSSGKGKSTLTAWLVTQGYHYLYRRTGVFVR